MADLRAAAQQALEALEYHVEQTRSIWKTSQAITALRDALAQQARAHFAVYEDGVCEVIDCCRNPPLILEALEIGYDSAQAEAAQYHAAMAGYRPERHAEMDADVAKIAKAISAVKAVLAQEAETTRAQRMRDEGYTRRPTLREMAQEEQEPVRAESVTTPPCKGMNCGAIDGRSHSLECHAEHLAAIAGGRFVSLSDKEISAMFPSHLRGDYKDLIPYSFARAIERALKEKNHG